MATKELGDVVDAVAVRHPDALVDGIVLLHFREGDDLLELDFGETA